MIIDVESLSSDLLHKNSGRVNVPQNEYFEVTKNQVYSVSSQNSLTIFPL